MSVVGSDYDELKQYNLAEIYDPTPKSTREGVAAAVEDRDDHLPPDVASKGSGLKDDDKDREVPSDKTSLDSLKAADGGHLRHLDE